MSKTRAALADYAMARQEALQATDAHARKIAELIPADRRLTDEEVDTVVGIAANDLMQRSPVMTLLPGLPKLFRDAFRADFVRHRAAVERA